MALISAISRLMLLADSKSANLGKAFFKALTHMPIFGGSALESELESADSSAN